MISLQRRGQNCSQQKNSSQEEGHWLTDNSLRPERFEGTDSTPGHWEHWFKTFSNFLSSLGTGAPDKLHLLTNYVAPSVYTHIRDCTTYDEAIKTLQTVFVKPVNEIFARHQLSTRKQQPGESVDQFLQFLKLLSRDCGFKAVTATVYAQESIRDAFISGLSSSVIRQRLLEKHTLTLDEAMQLAQSLELAQRNAETYVTQVVPPAPTACFVSSETSYSGDTCTAGSDGEVRITDASTTSAAVTEEGKRCYFCGRSVHSRLKCPARRQTCLKCGKVGHFANVCRSSNRRNIDNASAISLATLTAASTPSTTSSIMTVTVNVEPPFAPSPTPNLEPVSSERSESRETLQPSEPPEDSSSRVTSPPTVQPLRRSTREKKPVLRYPL
ncbi:hypothetical protein Pmani_016518 [Petrolisthes manimaculis]|uniref:CCHC-type domain-containing protein n=1 Tax=Petrolisthes manimaculis TaxID=1843537 RepID=A0AAE1PRH5_9EUCA|nr:hypothetical protein Pmani_016518 [Petrolisthes manimaculis]